MSGYKLYILLVMIVYIWMLNTIVANVIFNTNTTQIYNSTNFTTLNVNLISTLVYNNTDTGTTYYRGNFSLGERCKIDNDCWAIGAICENSSKICKCLQYLKEFPNRNECWGFKLGESCTQDRQCTFEVPGSRCYRGFCACSISFPLQEGSACLKDYHVGEQCNITAECANHRLVCNNGYCNCSSRNPVLFAKKCYEKVSIGGGCVNDAQCQALITGTICKQTCHCKKSSETASFHLRSCISDKNDESSITFELLVCVILFICPFIIAFICMVSWKFKFKLLPLWRQRNLSRNHRPSRTSITVNVPTIIKEDIPPTYEEVVTMKNILQPIEPDLPSYFEALLKLNDSTVSNYQNPGFSADL